VEYPLAMVLACLCRDVADEPRDARAKKLDIMIPIALGLLMVALLLGGRAVHSDRAGVAIKMLVAAPLFINYGFLKRPRRFALGVGACLIGGSLFGGILGTTVHVERNFFGVVRVTHDDAGKYVQIAHGTTLHGAQSRDPARRRDPLVYYSRTGPLGQVFDAFRAMGSGPKEVGVIGLGAGTMAPYRQPNETWTYYEIDPAVISIAENPAYFTYLTDAFPDRDHLRIVLGDARLRMHDAPDHQYDLIVVDAFSSDSIPAHLLTREAIALYVSKLAADGFIAVHISNRYLDLEPVFGNLAKDAKLASRTRRDFDVPQAELDAGKAMSQWLVLAPDVAHLGTIQDDARWVETRTSSQPVWTDDFSNLLSVYRW
ncbi:MAG: fused MFS/spermidine synthase, partial [Polyangiaceae bacterium]